MIQNTKYKDSLVVDFSTDNVGTTYTLVKVIDFNSNYVTVYNKSAGDFQVGYGTTGQEIDGPILYGTEGQAVQVEPLILNSGMSIYLKSLAGTISTDSILMNFNG